MLSLRPSRLTSLAALAVALALPGCTSEDEPKLTEVTGGEAAGADDPPVDTPDASAEGHPDEAESAGPPPEELRALVSPAEFERFVEGRGLVTNAEGAFEGFTLVMPLNSTNIHLVDLEGEPQHTWETGLSPGGWAYLAADGTLYRAARQDDEPHFKGGGIGGILQRLAPDGEVLWRFDFTNEERCQHHDLELLPNGNVLFIAWERHSPEEAVARGRDPRGVGKPGFWTDAIYEVRPTPPVGGEIVWSWHAWDHLVQDLDAAKPNHGAPGEHAGRLDVNANFVAPDEISDEERAARAEREQQMAALGYGGGDDEEEEEQVGPPPKDWDRTGDWTHTNAVSYHPDLDLIVMSSPELGEIFVIDHSTTSEEAAGSDGGRWDRGGEILWRWGNPERYGMGTASDQRLFFQHDPQWLRTPEGLKLTVFNNGGGRPDGSSYSEVLELSLPFDIDAGFVRDATAPFGPVEPDWAYADAETFYSAFISGASRLPNGNTLICSGVVGRIFEVTPDGAVVWDYYSPLGGDVEPPEHAGKAPPYALYRAARYGPDHPGIVALR